MGRKLRTQELKVNCDVKYYYYYQYCLICFGVIIINIVQYALVRYLRPTLYIRENFLTVYTLYFSYSSRVLRLKLKALVHLIHSQKSLVLIIVLLLSFLAYR